MLMKLGFFLDRNGQEVPIKTVHSGETLLIECLEPVRLLPDLVPGATAVELPLGAYLRGAFIPGEGALFELFDSLGRLLDGAISLDVATARELARRIR
ncbi:MAG: hypothetical protein HY815_16685 [Candidatus Riflebacteria bacterium]|nr:hypothetical protein [Candidatus Riflebacteria bacterium]